MRNCCVDLRSAAVRHHLSVERSLQLGIPVVCGNGARNANKPLAQSPPSVRFTRFQPVRSLCPVGKDFRFARQHLRYPGVFTIGSHKSTCGSDRRSRRQFYERPFRLRLDIAPMLAREVDLVQYCRIAIGSGDNENNRRGDRLPFRRPAFAHVLRTA